MIDFCAIDAQTDASLAAALKNFEAQFRYPLGRDRWFTISHGEDYTRFFRAIGEARCFIARRDAGVIGVISVSHCRMRRTDGAWVTAAYISDLKVSATGGGRCLLRLLRNAADWARRTPTTAGFSVIMDGTARRPTAYTGRLGIPAYTELGKLMVLRMPSDLWDADNFCQDWSQASLERVRARFGELTRGCFATDGGQPGLRSLMEAVGILLNDDAACGILEDTRRGKLLLQEDGREMVAAHLSAFGYRKAGDAVRLLRGAACVCRQQGMPALFVSVPMPHGESILKLLPQRGIVLAPATVYGAGFAAGQKWSINTAEI